MVESLQNLNDKFAIDDVISFVDYGSNYPVAQISGKESFGKIALFGAHILSFLPKGEEDLVWMSSKAIFEEGTPIRGGIPVCWPWFGPHPSKPGANSHGFARRKFWTVIATGVEKETPFIEFSLSGDASFNPYFPYAFSVNLKAFFGKTLRVELTTVNMGDVKFTVTNALHTYLRIGDVNSLKITGLEGVKFGDDLDSGKIKSEFEAITINSELDRNYRDTDSDIIIEDSKLNRKIIVKRENSKTSVVWNPWIEKSAGMNDFNAGGYKEMVCVEAVNAFDDFVVVNSGMSHTLVTEISCTK